MVERPDYSKVKVYASFAKPCSDVSKYYDKFAEAAHWANYVLFMKHKIILHEPTVFGTDTFEMLVEVPKAVGTFERANHLRGIARYLLKYYPNDFQKYKSGTRLLKYVIEEV